MVNCAASDPSKAHETVQTSALDAAATAHGAALGDAPLLENGYTRFIGTSTICFFLMIGTLIIPFWAVPLWLPDSNTHPSPHQQGTLTFHLSIAWYFVCSWLMGRLFICLRGPPQLGYIVSGFVLQFVSAPSWLVARPVVQMLAFMIVLIRAGLEISPQDLDLVSICLGTLPVIADALAIALFAHFVWDIPVLTGCVLGFTMAPMGDGLVIPKMLDFGKSPWTNAHVVARVVFTAAPLEMCTAILLHGVCVDFSREHSPPTMILLGLVAAKVLGTLLLTLVAAYIAASVVHYRKEINVAGLHFFANTDVEEAILVVGVVMLCFSLAGHEPTIISNGFDNAHGAEPLLQAEVAICTLAFFYSQFRSYHVHNLEQVFSQIWVVGALFLFTSLGCNIKHEYFATVPSYLPFIFVGIVARLVVVLLLGVLFYFFGPARRTIFCKRDGLVAMVLQALFVVLAGVTRATLQGALANLPSTANLFTEAINERIFLGGVLTLTVCASFGFYALDCGGAIILRRLHDIMAPGAPSAPLLTPELAPEQPAPDEAAYQVRKTKSLTLPEESWRHHDRLYQAAPPLTVETVVDPEYYHTSFSAIPAGYCPPGSPGDEQRRRSRSNWL